MKERLQVHLRGFSKVFNKSNEDMILALAGQLNLKNSYDSTGLEPKGSAMPVQCSNQLSYEVTQLRTGQFVGLMFSRERNVV